MVLGEHSEDLTPIFANRGALQLLPNKMYGRKWFNIISTENRETPKTVLSLPLNNPYNEIYSNTKAWWRVVDASLVMPEKEDEKIGEHFYKENLAFAEIFHDEMNDYYHDETYIHYGKSGRNKTWYNIDIDISFANIYASEGYGYGFISLINNTKYSPSDKEIIDAVPLDRYTYWFNSMDVYIGGRIEGQATLRQYNDAGDGTVPSSSMWLKGSGKVNSIIEIDNIEHGSSYNHEVSRLATLYGVCKIVENGEISGY